MKSLTRATVVATILIVLSSASYSYTPKPKLTFNLDSLTLWAKATHSLNDSASLHIGITAGIHARTIVSVRFANLIAPPDQQVGETVRDSMIMVDSGNSYSIAVPMRLNGYGPSLLSVTLSTPDSFPAPVMPVTRGLQVIFRANRFSVLDFTSSDFDTASCWQVVPPFFGSTIHIKGNLHYFTHMNSDTYQSGVYGDTVFLFFHPKGPDGLPVGSFLNLQHPLSGCQEGVHFSKVAEDGSFEFQFIGPPWQTYYTDAVLLATKGNDAVEVTSGASYEITTNCGKRTFFQELPGSTLALNSNTAINYPNVPVELMPSDGVMLRFGELSQEFARVRPVGVVPSRIPIRADNISSAGLFDPNNPPKIQINPGYMIPSTICHEYGHWTMWNEAAAAIRYSPEWPGIYIEGFAQFYASAVAHYALSTYQDPRLLIYDGAAEAGNFDGYYGYAHINDFAHFLWDIYDDYSDGTFLPASRGNEDNEDIHQQANLFAEVKSWNSGRSPAQFLSAIKSDVGSSSEEATSIQKIYDQDYSFSSDPKRPPQVKNAYGGSEVFSGGYVALNWDLQNYPTTVSYANIQTGIHIYQKDDNGVYQLVKTKSAMATGAVLTGDGGDLISRQPYFKVSTYNASGDACGALEVSVPAYKRSSPREKFGALRPLAWDSFKSAARSPRVKRQCEVL